MRARDHRCIFLGRAADHLHHVTGRDTDGVYLDPHFVVPLARGQHVLEHQCWAPLFDDHVAGDANVLRLRRTGHLLVRLSQHEGSRSVTLPGETILQLGLMLQQGGFKGSLQ